MLSWSSIRGESLTTLSLGSLADDSLQMLAGKTREPAAEVQERPAELPQLPYLPPELPLHIIQLAVSPGFPDDSLADRLTSLQSCSLFSRSREDVAQLEPFHSAVLYDTRAFPRRSHPSE